MPFGDLPPEVIHLICTHIPRRHLSALRLTNRTYAAIAARSQFSAIHLMFRRKSFDNLLEISNHPVFRHYVQSIYYEAILPEEPRSQGEWELQVGPPAAVDEKIMLEMPERPIDYSDRAMRAYRRAVKKWADSRHAHNFYSREKLDAAWQAYCAIYRETADVEMHSDDFFAIKAAFSKFDRLTSVVMSTFSDFSMYKISEEIKQSYEPALILPGFLRDRDPDEEIGMGARFLKSLIAGILDAKKARDRPFESLEIDCVDWEVFESYPIPLFSVGPHSHYEPPKPKYWRPVFEGLKRLRLDLAPDMFVSGSSSLERHAQLSTFLQVTSPTLEELYLTFGDVYSARENRAFVEPVLFDDLMGKKTYPRLSILRVHIADTNEEYFVDFMKRHRKTLKELDLAGLWLKDGEWPSAFLRLKEPWTDLDDLCLGGAFGMGSRALGDEIILPMQCHLDTDWTEAEHAHKKHLADYLEDYFLKDTTFPLRTVAEAEKLHLFPDAAALINIPFWEHPRGWY